MAAACVCLCLRARYKRASPCACAVTVIDPPWTLQGIPIPSGWKVHVHAAPYWEVLAASSAPPGARANGEEREGAGGKAIGGGGDGGDDDGDGAGDGDGGVVILSPDAGAVLGRIDPTVTYVIGGSVDRAVLTGQVRDTPAALQLQRGERH